MTEYAWAGKIVADFGALGALVVGIVLFYRLVDKWAARFLDAQGAQTTAMAGQAASTTALAMAVKEGQADQREILMAVRLLADRIDTQKQYLQQIEDNCKLRPCQP